MEHLILTETEFFRLIHTPGNQSGLKTAYEEFIAKVISLCVHPASMCSHPLHALCYAETELQYHAASQVKSHEDELSLHVHKALSFIRKMLEHIVKGLNPIQPPPIHSPSRPSPIRWTGSLSDLTELLYGLDTLKCINNGEAGINELLFHFSRLFGLELKEAQCYNAYLDIRRRKNDSRTYFFDKASEKLNLRIARDDERERLRKKK